jgi:hypothetical protein
MTRTRFVTQVGIATPPGELHQLAGGALVPASNQQPGVGGESGDPDNDVEDNPSEFNSMSDANDANSNRESAIVPTVRQSNYTAVLRGKQLKRRWPR